jgi:hypothetical protein
MQQNKLQRENRTAQLPNGCFVVMQQQISAATNIPRKKLISEFARTKPSTIFE